LTLFTSKIMYFIKKKCTELEIYIFIKYDIIHIDQYVPDRARVAQ